MRLQRKRADDAGRVPWPCLMGRARRDAAPAGLHRPMRPVRGRVGLRTARRAAAAQAVHVARLESLPMAESWGDPSTYQASIP